MAALTVFLVEDNPLIRAQLVPALEELAHAEILGTAEAEDEAVDWLARHRGEWRLAVVDFFLTRGNGLGVVCWALGRDPRQKVAVLTNFATPDTREQCLTAGADAVFDKSTELDQFFTFCREISAPVDD